MKITSQFILLVSLAIFECSNLRNLKLMDIEKYNKLCSVANQTMFQIYTLEIDFGGKTIKDLGNDDYKISLVVREDDQEIPAYQNAVFIPVNNGKATIPDIEYPKNVNLELLGTKHTLKEEF